MTTHTPTDEELALYAEGQLSPAKRKVVDDQLAEDRASRQRLEQIYAIAAQLASHDTELADADLVETVWRSYTAENAIPPVSAKPRAWKHWTLAAAACAIAAGFVGWLLLPYLFTQPTAEFRLKSSGPTAQEWVGVGIYRMRGQQVSFLDGHMRAKDALVFSYSNKSKHHFGYLSIFARAANGQLYWYYPAYLESESNPHSIAIQAGAINHELPDKIVHQLPVGELTIYAVFTDHPLPVKSIEQLFRQHRHSGLQHLPLPQRNWQQLVTIDVLGEK